MGKAGQTFFGGSKKKEESGNLNNNLLTSSLSPSLGYLTSGGNMVGSLLGVNGGPAQTQGLENFANSGGMQFIRDQGMKGIESNKAAAGLLKSGSTLTAMDKFNSGLASTYLDHYMSNLLDFSRLGLGAGGVLASSGAYSKGKGSEKPGILPGMQKAAAAAAAG